MSIRTFDISEDGSEKIRYAYRGLSPDGGNRIAVEGDYCRADEALAIEVELEQSRRALEQMQAMHEDEKAIVTRIREMLGNPAYEFLNGQSIYDIIQNGLDAIQLLSRYREGHRQPNGQECYLNIEQGDYRCADCIEADRLTGMERALRSMSQRRIDGLRNSLAKPNNGL